MKQITMKREYFKWMSTLVLILVLSMGSIIAQKVLESPVEKELTSNESFPFVPAKSEITTYNTNVPFLSNTGGQTPVL